MLPSSDPADSTLRIGLPTAVATLDPVRCRDSISLLAVTAVFETPFRPPEAGGQAEPILFTGPLELEVDGPDRWIYSGVLRDDVVFSDGTPLTPERLVASFKGDRIGKRRCSVSHRDRHILFELARPYPRLDLALTLAEASATLEKDGETLGTGPFRVAESAGETLRLVRNLHYRKAVGPEEVVFSVYPADQDGGHSRLVQAADRGEVDFVNCLSRNEVTPLTGLAKKFLPSTSTAVLYFNTERPGLSDPRVRKALARAVDRKVVTGVCHSNVLAFTAQSLLPPRMGLARDNIRHDPDQARRLLEEAGPAAPQALDLLVVWARRPYLPEPRAVAEVVARQISELGIRVELVPARDAAGNLPEMTAAEFFDLLERGDYDMVLVGWIADTPDPADFLESSLASASILRPGKTGVSGLNLSRWSDDATDEALERFRESPDFGTESKVMEILAEKAPLLPLMYGPSIVVHSWRLKGVELRADGLPRYDLLTLGG